MPRIGIDVPDYASKAMQMQGEQGQVYRGLTKKTGIPEPGPTVGGAVSAAGQGALIGAEIGSIVSPATATGAGGGPPGMAIAAAVALASYFLS